MSSPVPCPHCGTPIIDLVHGGNRICSGCGGIVEQWGELITWSEDIENLNGSKSS